MHNAQIFYSPDKLPSPGDVFSPACMDAPRIEEVVAPISVDYTLFREKAPINYPDFADGLDVRPSQSYAITLVCPPKQGSSSTIPHPWIHDIDRSQSSALHCEEGIKLLDADPFHYDWPYW
jgi:hypothetical protein